ncbi:MAG: helix-turn-helix domain-containing protein [Bacteroidota bacterium]
MIENVYLLFFVPLTLGLFQGMLFAVLLVVRGAREERLSDYLLAMLLFCGCLVLLPILLGLLDIHVLWNEWLFLPLNPGLLIGPLLYLFVIAHTNRGFRLTKQSLWHFFPFVVYAVYHIAIFVQGRDFVFHWMDAVDLPIINPIYQLLTLLSLCVYLWVTIQQYRQYQRWIEAEYANPEAHLYPWIKRFLWVVLLTVFITCLLRIIESVLFDFDYIQSWFTATMVAITTYYISIAGYMSARPPLTANLGDAKNEGKMADQEIASELKRLTTWMESNQAYLDPNLSLGTVAKAMDQSREMVSMVINAGDGKNFRGFVNTYRVEAFKQAVRAGQAKELTLFGLALECGFNSKATFNRVFKQIEGVTPNMFANGVVLSPPSMST